MTPSRTIIRGLDATGLSARHRRMLALGVHGAEGDELDLEALLARAGAESIGELSDEDLTALAQELREAGEQILADPTDDALAQAGQVRDAIRAVSEASATREADATRRQEEAEALLAEIRGDDGGGEGEGEEGEPAEGEGEGEAAGEGDAEGEGEGEAEGGEGEATEGDAEGEALPIAASGAPRVSRVAARRPQSTRPRPARVEEREYVLMASANVPGVQAGQRLDTPDLIIRAFEGALRATGRHYDGPRVNIPIMSIGAFDPAEIYGEGRTLRDSARENERRISTVCSPAALRASGGICAPSPVDYTFPVLGSTARPFRDALARFGADRGGVRLFPPPTLADLANNVSIGNANAGAYGAVAVWTEANDESPATPATKPCIVMDCPDDDQFFVDAITQCIQIGNFRRQFFPEQVQAWITKAASLTARIAETRLIHQFGTQLTQITGHQVLGTTRNMLATMDRYCAALRNRQRVDPDTPVRMAAPAWLLDNMISDLAREMPGATAERLATSDAQIESFFASRQINVTWFYDGESGQTFGPQADGGLLPWPDSVIFYVWFEGQGIYGDGGSLDFGIVRDSVLNSTNDLQMFSEFFEFAAFHGEEGARISLDICASGETAPSANVSSYDPCLGNS